MRNMFRRITALTMIAALLAVTVSDASARPAGQATATASSPVVATGDGGSSLGTPSLVGTGGRWQKLACIGCIAAFGAASITGSVYAVMLVMATYPEAAALCAAGCYAAFN
ncbi:MAG: hypothetical protein ACYC1S_13345 [Gemmatimonadaceae bacterium]